MVDFFILFLINIILIEFISYYSILIDQIIFVDNIYFFIFSFFFFVNFILIEKKEVFNVNLDLLLKYYSFFLKTPNFFFNFFFNIMNKIYIFYVFFKYKFFMDTNKIIFKNVLSTFFLKWKPLFKKFSYFGYFRSNRSKWIK